MKTLLTTCLVLFLLAVITPVFQVANCGWIIDDDIEDIILERVDYAVETPYHEEDAGVYGYQDENQVWHIVIDFNTSYVIQEPYTWSEVRWESCPLDWEE